MGTVTRDCGCAVTRGDVGKQVMHISICGYHAGNPNRLYPAVEDAARIVLEIQEKYPRPARTLDQVMGEKKSPE